MGIDKDHGAAAEPLAHVLEEMHACAMETFGAPGILAAIERAQELRGKPDPHATENVAAWLAILDRWREERE